jgi:magnesium-transporting ATPase (P-type)
MRNVFDRCGTFSIVAERFRSLSIVAERFRSLQNVSDDASVCDTYEWHVTAAYIVAFVACLLVLAQHDVVHCLAGMSKGACEGVMSFVFWSGALLSELLVFLFMRTTWGLSENCSAFGVTAHRISSIRKPAAVDVCCLEKTGTIASDQLTLHSVVGYVPTQVLDRNGVFAVWPAESLAHRLRDSMASGDAHIPLLALTGCHESCGVMLDGQVYRSTDPVDRATLMALQCDVSVHIMQGYAMRSVYLTAAHVDDRIQTMGIARVCPFSPSTQFMCVVGRIMPRNDVPQYYVVCVSKVRQTRLPPTSAANKILPTGRRYKHSIKRATTSSRSPIDSLTRRQSTSHGLYFW